MFITKTEKEWMTASIQTLQQQVKEFRKIIEDQMEHNNRLKEIIAKSKLRVKGPKRDRGLVTAEAPWGLKKDGTPCKKPGRARKSEVQL
jgi:hypothetical protein